MPIHMCRMSSPTNRNINQHKWNRSESLMKIHKKREKKTWLLLLFAHARTCIVSRVSHLALIYLYLSCVLLGESVCVYSDTDPIEWWDFINHFNMRQKDVLSTASACSETHLKGERSATCCIHIRRHCHRLRTVCDFPVRKKSRDVDLNERNHCERTAMTTKIRFEKTVHKKANEAKTDENPATFANNRLNWFRCPHCVCATAHVSPPEPEVNRLQQRCLLYLILVSWRFYFARVVFAELASSRQPNRLTVGDCKNWLVE